MTLHKWTVCHRMEDPREHSCALRKPEDAGPANTNECHYGSCMDEPNFRQKVEQKKRVMP